MDDMVLRARSDAEALGKLYERSYDRVFRYCVRRLFLKEMAEDVTAAVFLHVAERVRDFRGTSEREFRNWLYAIATNEIRTNAAT